MNPRLKPYLIGLRENYTQYQIEDILRMKSVYAIRIYELLMKERSRITRGPLPKNGIHIKMSISDIRLACNCEDKYERISQFKSKVLDMAVAEINRVTTYRVGYTDLRERGRITSVTWTLNMCYH